MSFSSLVMAVTFMAAAALATLMGSHAAVATATDRMEGWFTVSAIFAILAVATAAVGLVKQILRGKGSSGGSDAE